MPELGAKLTEAEKGPRELKQGGTWYWVTCPDCPEGNLRPGRASGALSSNRTRRCLEHTRAMNKGIHGYMINGKQGTGNGRDGQI